MVYELEPFADFILASETKFDPGDQKWLFEKFLQLNEKHCWKGLMKIYLMVYELEPFKDFILTSKVKIDPWVVFLAPQLPYNTSKGFLAISSVHCFTYTDGKCKA